MVEILAMSRIEEIHRRIPNCHLVMHGSSSVPQELQDIINQFGGQIRGASGCSGRRIKEIRSLVFAEINVSVPTSSLITVRSWVLFEHRRRPLITRDYPDSGCTL
ncbi:MAG: hypothetical protein R3B96_05560 [Pirellulaceae bacterium]